MEINNFNNLSGESFLNGIQSNSEIPIYTINDIDKKLTVNSSGASLIWSNESAQNGYISQRGDGSMNDVANFVGYIFKNRLNSGLFNYTSGAFDILALRINNLNVLECTPGQINANQNLFFIDDSLLSSQRINFGLGNCGISGYSLGSDHSISFRTDNQERMRIGLGNSQQILFKTPLKIDTSITYNTLNPQIYSGTYGSNCCGINFDTTYNSLKFTCSSVNYPLEIFPEKVTFNNAAVFGAPVCQKILMLDGTSKTLDTGLTDAPVIYMKRNASANTDLTINGVSVSPPETEKRAPLWTIYVDAQGVGSTFNCRIVIGSIDVLFFSGGGTRSLVTSGSINLAINATYTFQYVPSDDRMILVRVM